MSNKDTTNKPRILIIEDDELLSSMYFTKFSKEGFDVLFCDNGEAGLSIAKKERPNIILLDILLPGINGFEVLKKLKEDGATALIPVILLTNVSEPAEMEKGMKLGAVDYLVKVFHVPTEVVEKVKARLHL